MYFVNMNPRKSPFCINKKTVHMLVYNLITLKLNRANNSFYFKIFYFSESELRKSKSYVSCEKNLDNSERKKAIKGFKTLLNFYFTILKS